MMSLFYYNNNIMIGFKIVSNNSQHSVAFFVVSCVSIVVYVKHKLCIFYHVICLWDRLY